MKPARPFPAEFSNFLSPDGRRVLEWGPDDARTLRASNGRCLLFRDGIDPSLVTGGVATLEDEIAPHLEQLLLPISPDSHRFTAALPTCERKQGGNFRRDGPRFKPALEIGLLQMIYSESYLRFAEAASGYALGRRRTACSIARYEAGDYVGPHTDAAPSDQEQIVLAFSLSNGVPARQTLIWEGDDGLTEAAEVANGNIVQVMRAPAWHMVSPLMPERDGDRAVRWFVAQVFRITAPRTQDT